MSLEVFTDLDGAIEVVRMHWLGQVIIASQQLCIYYSAHPYWLCVSVSRFFLMLPKVPTKHKRPREWLFLVKFSPEPQGRVQTLTRSKSPSTSSSLSDDNEPASDSETGGEDSNFCSDLSDRAPLIDPFLDKAQLEDEVERFQRELLDVTARLNQAKTQLSLEQSRQPAVYNDQHFQNKVTYLQDKIRRWTSTHSVVTRRHTWKTGSFGLGSSRLVCGILCNGGYLTLLILTHGLVIFFAGHAGKYPLERSFAEGTKFLSDCPEPKQKVSAADLGPIPDAKHIVSGESQISHFSFMEKDRKAPIWKTLRRYTVDMSLPLEVGGTGLDFDPNCMEEVDKREARKYVRLIVSPLLVKGIDKTDGTIEHQMLMKAEVCLDTVCKLAQSHAQQAMAPIYTRKTQNLASTGPPYPYLRYRASHPYRDPRHNQDSRRRSGSQATQANTISKRQVRFI
ncbi:uncharacterized protein BDR25DRAFT_353218 [Lindgomyces ingoldianus]|uniref:Uncharacterized protein n=1 Tax=Lindgomyces ingoldianus TaxID=673940 RepID=A0ACB6R1D9_9PLEO|nr:uncharacterized protein BDR25DRAFT_353218 [Lindgomyces ingoldianus]KAF2472905.1 hypothetical protein BDR25DRAFT_353218 [Lindgomyces ingoldianus]